MLKYVIQQVLWTISVSAQLLAAMGLGFKWISMAIRLVLFAMLIMWYLVPHVCSYILSPNIIRRVAYRSSKQTRLRNLRIFLQQVRNIPPTRRSREGHEAAENASGRQSGPDMVAVELLAKKLNPADGRLLMNPQQQQQQQQQQQPFLDASLPDVLNDDRMKIGSFSDAVAFIQNYYAASAAGEHAGGGDTLAGERQTPYWTPDASLDPTSTGDSEDEEDRNNLHNRATLDIYLPVPLDSLFRMMEQEKKISPRSVLRRKRFPVVISVIGGAWILGFYFWNVILAPLLAARGYVVFCPDYRNFPQTDMEGMILDVSDAIGWVVRNAERYGGDPEDVTVIGQSAGAHLTMMSLLSQAQLSAYAAAGGTPPSSMAYNVPRYNPRESIRQYIGLSGIYNIRCLVKHFDRRGLYRNVLYQMAGGRSKLSRYSLNSYFDEQRGGDTGEVIPKNIFDFLPQRMYFIHGDADCSAPVSESANLAFVMRNAQSARLAQQYTNGEQLTDTCHPQPVDIKYILVPGANHTDAIIDECLAAGESHILDFLCYYSTRNEVRSPCVNDGNGPRDADAETDEDDGHIDPSRHPDGVLPSPAPHNERPLLIRLGGYVCPF